MPAAPEPHSARGVVRHETEPPEVEQAVETAEPRECNRWRVDPTDDVTLPTRLVNVAEEETYHLEVDFGGFQGVPTAWVASRTMTGGIEEEEWDADDNGVAWIWLGPGTYEVWWFDSEGTRLGTRARIEEGQVTRLRAVDHRGPAPLPAGVGALRVHLTTISGGVLAEESVYVGRREGSDKSLCLETDSRGQVDAILSPGRYVVSYVDYESEVDVEDGRTTLHRIEHGREGDLVLVSDRPGHISIEHAERGRYYAAVDLSGTETLTPYLLEGEYDVMLEDLVSLGRAAVHAGRTTRFRCELPPGGIAVPVLKTGTEEFGAADVTVRRVIDGRETKRGVSATRGEPIGRLDLALPAGRYVVTASAKECEAASAEVDVADTLVELTLALRPLR